MVGNIHTPPSRLSGQDDQEAGYQWTVPNRHSRLLAFGVTSERAACRSAARQSGSTKLRTSPPLLDQGPFFGPDFAIVVFRDAGTRVVDGSCAVVVGFHHLFSVPSPSLCSQVEPRTVMTYWEERGEFFFSWHGKLRGHVEAGTKHSLFDSLVTSSPVMTNVFV